MDKEPYHPPGKPRHVEFILEVPYWDDTIYLYVYDSGEAPVRWITGKVSKDHHLIGMLLMSQMDGGEGGSGVGRREQGRIILKVSQAWLRNFNKSLKNI